MKNIYKTFSEDSITNPNADCPSSEDYDALTELVEKELRGEL